MQSLKFILLLLLLAGGAVLSAFEAYADGVVRTVNDDLMYRISFGRADDVKTLLENGAETDIYGVMGDTPLTLAIHRNQYDADSIVKVLIAKGADPNYPDKNGKYPLEVAIEYDHTDVVKTLVDAGADVHMKTQDGLTMTQLANKLNKTGPEQVLMEQEKKLTEQEAAKHEPAYLLILIHEFSSQVCELNYWSNYLASEQNPADDDSTRQKIEKNKGVGEKVGQQIVMYFPNVQLDSYIRFSKESINNVFKSMPSIPLRKQSGIGTDDDARKRCEVVANAARNSIEQLLNIKKPESTAQTEGAEITNASRNTPPPVQGSTVPAQTTIPPAATGATLPVQGNTLQK